MPRIEGTYLKFVNKQAQKGLVKTISPEATFRIDTQIADAFEKAHKKSVKKQVNSAHLLFNRLGIK